MLVNSSRSLLVKSSSTWLTIPLTVSPICNDNSLIFERSILKPNHLLYEFYHLFIKSIVSKRSKVAIFRHRIRALKQKAASWKQPSSTLKFEYIPLFGKFPRFFPHLAAILCHYIHSHIQCVEQYQNHGRVARHHLQEFARSTNHEARKKVCFNAMLNIRNVRFVYFYKTGFTLREMAVSRSGDLWRIVHDRRWKVNTSNKNFLPWQVQTNA